MRRGKETGKQRWDMLREKTEKLISYAPMRKILSFFDGIGFPAAFAILALLSAFFGLEIPFFILTALIVVFICLFSRDTRPIFVPLVLTLFGMSWKHTPQPPYHSQFLNSTYVFVILGILAALAVAAFIYRMIVWRGARNFFRDKSAYKWSIAALSGAFLLNGVFFTGWKPSDLLLGVLYIFAFFALYVFFYNTLEKREGTGVYVASVLTIALGVVLIQLFKILLFDNVIEDGSINKDLLIAGWGMSNNIGGYLALFLPACFYLSAKVRRGWLFYLFGFVVYCGILLTLSRTSALIGGAALVAMMIYLSVKKSPVRTFARACNIVCVVAALIFAAVFREKIKDIFAVFFERGFDSSGRFFIWKNGLRNFLRAPVFGVGFYEPIAPDWSYGIESWFFPDMYHNLFIQMLASCGIVGLGALVFHLVQFAIVVFRKGITFERLFYVAVACMVLGLSLLDNHIFRILPTLVYSAFILLAEREQRLPDAPLRQGEPKGAFPQEEPQNLSAQEGKEEEGKI